MGSRGFHCHNHLVITIVGTRQVNLEVDGGGSFSLMASVLSGKEELRGSPE